MEDLGVLVEGRKIGSDISPNRPQIEKSCSEIRSEMKIARLYGLQLESANLGNETFSKLIVVRNIQKNVSVMLLKLWHASGSFLKRSLLLPFCASAMLLWPGAST